jgi:hypothetical protein
VEACRLTEKQAKTKKAAGLVRSVLPKDGCFGYISSIATY